MSDAARIQQLFASKDLDELIWQGNVDHFADGAAFVDVVISSEPTVRDRVTADVYKIGLTYWPDGPVVRGVQNYTHGKTTVMERVLVAKGKTLALAAFTSWNQSPLAVQVDVVPSGKGRDVGHQRENEIPNPLSDLNTTIGLVLGIAALVAVAYLVSKVE